MRVVSLVILLLVLGGGAFVFIHEPTRNWVFKKTVDASLEAQGYSYAKTPREAMDNFEKAIKTRNFKAAARYCSDDYAKVLEKTHEAAQTIGLQLDKIYDLLHGKSMRTPAAVDLLVCMDPFPNTFAFKEVKETKKGETAEGSFVFVEPKKDSGRSNLTDAEINKLDLKIYNVFALMPVNFFAKTTISKDKDKDIWKINFVPKKEACEHFVDGYKRYKVGYAQLIDELNRDTFLADQVAPELLTVMIKSK